MLAFVHSKSNQPHSKETKLHGSQVNRHTTNDARRVRLKWTRILRTV